MKGLQILRKGALVLTMSALAIPALAADNVALRSSVQQKLGAKQFAHVSVVANEKGLVTLSGTVAKYQAKQDAEKKAKKVTGVAEVDNQIQVGTKDISDADLQQALNRSIAYDRVGYWNVFDNVVATVHNGSVTLEGEVRDYPAKDAAVGLVANREGVKDVVDNIKVLPLSPYDDEVRLRTRNAIYGNAVLSKYGADPKSPIRVIVQGGNVSLYGTVDSEADKNVAAICANGVPGVFSVHNYLRVARG